jgi:hypothetical protein
MNTPDTLGSPDPTRGGADIDEAIANSEKGSQVEGVHTREGMAESGESRLEQMPEVEGVTEGRVDGDPSAPHQTPKPGPSPRDLGSGGAQRIAGARISDRKSAGEAVPDGPPFDKDSEGNPSGPPD